MSKLNSFSQLDKAMMDSPVYRNERAFEERSKREEEHKARLQEVDKLTDGIPLDRLREMCAAERDGRCVVLPCKVGDTVYEPYDGRIFTWPFHGASVELHVGGGVRMMDDFGKTVFLTRAEAEAALAQEGGQDV